VPIADTSAYNNPDSEGTVDCSRKVVGDAGQRLETGVQQRTGPSYMGKQPLMQGGPNRAQSKMFLTQNKTGRSPREQTSGSGPARNILLTSKPSHYNIYTGRGRSPDVPQRF